MPIVSIPKNIRKAGQKGPLVLSEHRTSLASAEMEQRPGLQTTPQRVTAGVQTIARASADIGPTDEQQQQSITMPIDPKVSAMTDTVVRTLPAVPGITTRSGVTAEAQKTRLGKFDAGVTLFSSAVTTSTKVDDSRRVLNKSNTLERQHLKAKLLLFKDDPRLKPEQRRRLVAELARLQAEEDAIAQEPVDLAQKTLRDTRLHQSRLAEMGMHTELIQTMADQQNGIPIDDVKMAQTVEAYQAYEDQKAQAAAAALAADQRNAKR